MGVRDLTWKHVAIILGFFATIAALTMTGNDAGAFIAVGTAILVGIGIVAVKTTEATQQTAAVRDQTNGNMTRMLQILEGMANKMAEMQPPHDK